MGISTLRLGNYRLDEPICNVALGLSTVFWACAGVWEDRAAIAAPRVVLSALQVVVGYLFLTRVASRRDGDWRELASCVPSFLAGGALVKLAGPMHQWPLLAQTVFSAAGVWTIASLLSLGKSFSVFPALRQIVVRGPYRWIRHPAYAGEWFLMLGATAARGTTATWLLFAGGTAALAWRIETEERFLAGEPGYAEYRRGVRWRCVPGLY